MSETIPKMVLPTEISLPSKVWGSQRFLTISQAGVGKSTFWSNDPGAFFIDTEGNLNHLGVKKLPCRSWEDFRSIYGLLYEAAQTGKYPYTTLVIDTIDRLLSRAEEEVIIQAKDKYPKAEIYTIGDVPKGNGWAKVTTLMDTALHAMDQLPSALVLISHPKSVQMDEPTGKYDKETICLWGQVGTKVLGFAQHTLQVQAMYAGDQLVRIVRSLPSKGLEAKSHGGIVPDRMEWKSRDLKAEFEVFRALFT